jgi:hypothetical protein
VPVPSATNMKFKFPEFRVVDDTSIEFAIEEAVVACGSDDWIDDANQTLGLMYYAAHLLQVSLERAKSGSGQIVTSERTPELSVSYASPPQSAAGEITDLSTTRYGIRFRELVQKNFPAILTVGSAVRM